MGGALTQLAAYGAQDVYLTGGSRTFSRKENFKGQRDFSMKPMNQDDIDTVESTESQDDVYPTRDLRTFSWNENFKGQRDFSMTSMRQNDLYAVESNGFMSKRTVVGIASAVSLAALSFFLTRDIRLSLICFVAIGVIFTFIRWTQ